MTTDKGAAEISAPVTFERLRKDVSDVTGGTFNFGPGIFAGHQMAPINFNSLGRIVDMHRGEVVTALAAERDEWKECAETQMRGHGETQQALDTAVAERDALKKALSEAEWNLAGTQTDLLAVIGSPPRTKPGHSPLLDTARRYIECGLIAARTALAKKAEA